jgi:hypothetical protein
MQKSMQLKLVFSEKSSNLGSKTLESTKGLFEYLHHHFK